MRRDSSDTATFAAVGIGAVTVACCAGMPAIAALVAGLSLAATLGIGAGLVALAGLVGADHPRTKAKRPPAGTGRRNMTIEVLYFDDCPNHDAHAASAGVAAGDAIFGPGIAARVLALFAQPAVGPAPAFPELTTRERQILELMARGEPNARIAKQLFLSQKTVRNYASNIFTKLRVVDRTQAVARARDAGLGNPPG